MADIISKNYININSPHAIMDASKLIFDNLYSNINYFQDLIILCIGTDRSTGDSLGPLVGHKLNHYLSPYKKVHLFGTLDEPVHAKNLEHAINQIDSAYINPFILAVDASLGNFNKIGYININKGPLKPGLGVNKDLPPIGDMNITGIVNVGGIMEYMVLQNTRLSLVMNMAETITKSINIALFKLYNKTINQQK
ncbi:putative sporulation protein YyaC [Keratinibaculum paraultunense]|uniref:Putative sporulation protein YyaC n=1 Tax=Keratinibaculum paraultunense TaxID=1278232 RepID=A0A4R3KQS9_9FIRM|nr:spore protease YyaC [Keratinibaculum paraultunense]QQY79744.1 spore protease YyaC [Keratinibaculum paraultunense]TCS86947.1 putative sporulation protein YyaC [Keratinibaculum paraultunense]